MLIHNADITGSLLVNGTRFNTGSFSGSFTGIVAGTTATASYVEYSNVANKPALVSGSSQITYSGLTGIPSGIVSGSSQVTYSGLTGIPSGIVSGSAQVAGFGIFATTGSNGFNGSQSITGSLTVTGQVVAQTLNVQQVTSSIVYSSGSNIFGNSLGNTQQFTGSVGVTGSLTVAGAGTFTGALNGTSANFNGNITLNGAVTRNINFYNDTNSILNAQIQYDQISSNTGQLFFGTNNSGTFATRLTIASTGAATFASTISAGQSLFQVSDTGVGTKTIVSTLERTGATPSGSEREVGIVFKDGNNPTIVGGITGIRYNSAGNFIGGLRFYVQNTSATPATSFSNLLTALTLDYTGAANFSNSVTAENGVYVRSGNGVYVNNTANTRTGYFITSGNGTELSSHNGAGEPLILIAPDSTATIRFYTAGSTVANERMRITNSGITVVGHTASIGTNFSPPIQVKGGAGIGNGFGIISGNNEMVGGLQLASSGTNSFNIAADPDNLRASTEIGFTIDGSSKMTINSSGFVGIGVNPSYLLHIPQDNALFLSNLFVTGTANNPRLSSGATGGSMSLEGGGAEEGKIYLQGAGSGGNGYIEFYAGGSLRMTISDNGSIGAPSGTNIFNPSDLRLKRNISTISNGLDKISALNPIKFNWIDGFEPSEDGKDMLGFVAQEVYEVIPEAVESFSGNSILVNDIEIENPLRINEKFIIPVLVKAIQELKSENDTLKSRIDTLEQA